MDPELELTITFCVSIIFQVLYIKYRENIFALIYSSIAAVAWMATAQAYLVSGPQLTGTVWIFYALFIINALLTVYDAGMIFLYGVPDQTEEEIIID